MEYKGIEVTFFCSRCSREFKTLAHFNRWVNRRNGARMGCVPFLRADGRHRLEAEWVDGRIWAVRKQKRGGHEMDKIARGVRIWDFIARAGES